MATGRIAKVVVRVVVILYDWEIGIDVVDKF